MVVDTVFVGAVMYVVESMYASSRLRREHAERMRRTMHKHMIPNELQVRLLLARPSPASLTFYLRALPPPPPPYT